MKKIAVFLTVFAIAFLYGTLKGNAQEYKLRQVVRMEGSKMESTVFVKGKRQRTEMVMEAMPVNLVVIEQCDLKRTIKINDKTKRYYIELFASERIQPAQQDKALPAKQEKTVRKGGVINMWYSITDTGERKKMFGFTARHVWTSQKMKPSADACGMKDSMLIRTDGWYIDLPLYECKQRFGDGGGTGLADGGPECQDKIVSHTSGKGKIGFPIQQTTTTIIGNSTHVSKMEIETLELSTAKLDTLLFTISPGYQRVYKEEELLSAADIGAMMKETMVERGEPAAVINKDEKAPGQIRIGVFVPSGSADVSAGELQQHLVNAINARNLEAIPVSSEEEAKKYYCDYTLNTVFTNVKSDASLGGVVKAIKRRDPNLTRTYSIQGALTLLAIKDGTEKNRQAMDGKYEGSINEAASKALDEACLQVLKGLK